MTRQELKDHSAQLSDMVKDKLIAMQFHGCPAWFNYVKPKDGTDNETPSLEQMLSDLSNTILRAIEGEGYWITKTNPSTHFVIDRERLAKLLFAYERLVSGVDMETITTHWDMCDWKEPFYSKADYIISNQSSIIRQGKMVGVEEIEKRVSKYYIGKCLAPNSDAYEYTLDNKKLSKAIHDLLGREG